jgi:hypothetical protein
MFLTMGFESAPVGCGFEFALDAGRQGVGKGWARGGLITSFNIYIYEEKKFTS